MLESNGDAVSIGQVPIGFNSTVDEEIDALKRHVQGYRRALDSEGVWLFIATLGCWSVTNEKLQFIAFIVAGMLFGERMAKRSSENRSFSKLVEKVEERIGELLPEGDARKARLYDLVEFRKSELSVLKSVRHNKVFFVCWLFYGASLIFEGVKGFL